MTDILIRDVPEDVVAAIDRNAQRQGLTRAEYLRRTLARERTAGDRKVTVEDFERMAELVEDALDPEVRRAAWS
jgi:hypothetical protein